MQYKLKTNSILPSKFNFQKEGGSDSYLLASINLLQQ